MESLFLWEIGTPTTYLVWIVVFISQILIAEINRRWNWTVFFFWTFIGVALIPYAIIHGNPMVGWFPFGKYVIMVATATLNGCIVSYALHHPEKARRYGLWVGVAIWLGLAANIMEANIRDITIYFQSDTYYACAANWECLKGINDSRTVDMLAGLPESRGITAPLHSQEWYQALAANFQARHVGIDPATGFRTIGGYWNIMSAIAGLLNIITITGVAKVIVTSKKEKVRGLIWVDQIWPWIIAYDLWNHAFLYNSLADYTWFCTFALLLACTIPAFTWAKGQWLWFRCYTLMFWIAMNNIFPEFLVPPSAIQNYATMNPTANIVCSGLALIANVALFIYWLYKVIITRRNPVLNVMFEEFSEFRKVGKLLSDKDKYFLTDMIDKTPQQLGLEPESKHPPRDGYVGWMPWWKTDKRYPKERTPLSADPYLIEKGVKPDPQWDSLAKPHPKSTQEQTTK